MKVIRVTESEFELEDGRIYEHPIEYITKNTKGRSSKNLRKQLGHWNLNLLFLRIANKCEENRVLFALVDPKYTSQECSSCGAIHKESRNGEIYSCISCGFELDSDLNASKNILNRFLNEEFTVPHESKETVHRIISTVESPDYCDDEDCNTLANAGYGTDEDYGYFENDDY